MSTTTVRLDDEDEAILDLLALEYGGRSSAIRHALRYLAADHRQQEALRRFVTDWDADEGAVDEADIAAMADRYDPDDIAGLAAIFGPAAPMVHTWP